MPLKIVIKIFRLWFQIDGNKKIFFILTSELAEIIASPDMYKELLICLVYNF